jgi:hypothetical protein
VQSGDAIQIAYAGTPLAAHQKCWWKVKVWDQNGAESAWSGPAYWTTGPMKSEDWAGAKWVGLDTADSEAIYIADSETIYTQTVKEAPARSVRSSAKRVVVWEKGEPEELRDGGCTPGSGCC